MPLGAAAREELAEKRRAEILEAAFRVFARKGYHDTNVADIAAELAIGHGTIYRYFKNKLDVFHAVVEEAIARVAAVVSAEAPDATSSLDAYRAQIERIGLRLFALFEQERDLARILFTEALGTEPAVAAKVDEAMDLFATFTEQYLQNGQAKGFLRRGVDTRVIALAVNAMIFEGARRLLRGATADATAPREADRNKARDKTRDKARACAAAPNDVTARWVATVADLMLNGLKS
jgi:AcrR family transcriptional regulator